MFNSGRSKSARAIDTLRAAT